MNQNFKVIWASSAVRDLENIIDYIALANPLNAKQILSKIKKSVSNLYLSPQRGRIVPELQEQGILVYRELIITPWRVVYRITEHKVFILTVFDSRQNIEDILLKKLSNIVY